MREHELDDDEDADVSETGDREGDEIGAGFVDDSADELLEEESADGAGHSAETDDGADGGFGGDIGGESEDVGGPALVRGGGEADEGDRGPHMVFVNEADGENGEDAKG